jgi:cytochrome c oxidase subunit II
MKNRLLIASTLVVATTYVATIKTQVFAANSEGAIHIAQVELDPVVVRRGSKVAKRKGCAACHSTDGSSRAGPTWKGLYNSERALTDDTTVLADEAYLLQSIIDPNVKIAAGFSKGLMPKNYGTKLKEEDLKAVITFIMSLQ